MTNITVTKLSQLKAFAKAGAWQKAIGVAAKFDRLGIAKAPILQAQEAYLRPDFQKQIGRDPAKLIAAGIAALKERYNV